MPTSGWAMRFAMNRFLSGMSVPSGDEEQISKLNQHSEEQFTECLEVRRSVSVTDTEGEVGEGYPASLAWHTNCHLDVVMASVDLAVADRGGRASKLSVKSPLTGESTQ